MELAFGGLGVNHISQVPSEMRFVENSENRDDGDWRLNHVF